MIRGKLTDITLDDVIQLAAENGIRKADSIIHEVAKVIREFRSLALKQGAQERWIAAIEHTLEKNLEAWGLTTSMKVENYIDENGRNIDNIRIEQQFKGNYHLTATVDGIERNYVIRKKTAEHDEISRTGISNLTEKQLRELVAKFFTQHL